MKINEIFKSISGEASFAGLPCIFIRTYGCNLRCDYCDTMYAVEGGDYITMDIEGIFKECQILGPKHIILTGGEPLIQPDAPELVDLLCDNGYTVEIETNGAVKLSDFHAKLKTKRKDLLHYTMDFKTFTSRENTKMVKENLEFLLPKDVVKFVVGCKEDLELMDNILDANEVRAQVYVSPVFGNIEPADIVSFILGNNLYQCKVQLQLHKIIYPVDMRGV